MKQSSTKKIALFYREGNREALKWVPKIKLWIRQHGKGVKLVGAHERPQVLIVLGGDGTILEATRKYQKFDPIFIGLNLGQVGFLASVREPKKFLVSLDKFFRGEYSVVERMMLDAIVTRNGKPIFSTNALNEVVAQNLLGMVEIEASVDGHPVQNIRGTGVMVATSTGSTAYNLSAHGPIVTPDIKCLIVTEVFDHDIPTPSIIIKNNKEIHLKILHFRERGLLAIAKTGQDVDVLLVADGETVFPLQKKDLVIVRRSPQLVRFAELEEHYFFKSLQEKFSFK